MKTRPMKHQVRGEQLLLAAPKFFALGAEQGTGKTWMLLNDAEHQFESGDIDALFVIAPKGVHTNWVRREIPTHLSVAHQAAYWLSGGGKKRRAAVDRLLRQEPGEELLVLTMNVDAVNTKDGFDVASKFLKRFRCMMVVDESQRIKNLEARRTKRVHALGKLAVSRRIASGTLVANNPLDLFAQYEFLQSGLLGTTSFRAFTAEFAEVLPTHHPLVRQIVARSRGHGAPQVIRRDENGTPVFRNIEKLRNMLSPHTYRVLKRDCLDLPEKIYQTHFFELTPAQRKLYNQVKADLRYTRDDGTIDTFTALTAINKLRQVTSGFILVDGEAASMDASARLAALAEVLEDVSGQVIIWASFREEIAQISAMLKNTPHVQYHGGTSASEREEAVDAFQRGDVRVFVANPAAGGTGLTLTAASTAIYYSNSFSLEDRLQSEDRCHRIGTREPVVYIDLVAQDTIDERIAVALQAKSVVAAQVLDGA